MPTAFTESLTEQLTQCLAEARDAQHEATLELGLARASEAWAHARQLGFLAEQIEAGRLRVYFHYRRGELQEMLELSQEVQALMRPLGPSAQLCELLRWTSLAASELGDFETGLNCANEGHELARALGDKRVLAAALNALGACFERMGDPWQAERLMNEAAALARDEATAYERVITLNNLCTTALGEYHLMRDSGHESACQEALQRALHYGREVRPHARQLGELYALALTDSNLGEVLLLMGELGEAEPYLRAALAQAQARQFDALAGRVHCNLAELALAQDDLARAWTHVLAVQDETTVLFNSYQALRLHRVAYRCAKAEGNLDEALHHLEAFQRLERRRSVAQLMAQSRFFVSRLEAEQARAAADQAHARVSVLTARTQELEAHVQRDPLTGLGNRRFLEARMPALIVDCEQQQRALTLALIDADHFKQINDQHGHAIGDAVLQHLAQLLRENTRGSDLLLRYGGEEFLAVLPDTVADRAFEVCERLRQSVESHPWQDLAPGLVVTLSIGLASAPPYSTDLLISRADAAMYRAKHLGRNRVALA